MDRRKMMQVNGNKPPSNVVINWDDDFKNSNTFFGYYCSWNDVGNLMGKTVNVAINLTCKIKNSNGKRPDNTNFSPLGYRPTWGTLVPNGLSDVADADGYFTQNISAVKQVTFPSDPVGYGPLTYRTNYCLGSIVGAIKIEEV